MPKHVALYLRLSPRPDAQYEGVDRQETWGRAYAEQKWPGQPVEVYADTGISAVDAARPGYERLRDAIASGEVSHLWTVEQSRLERDEIGWFLLVAELVEAGVDTVHTDRDGVVHLDDATGGVKAVLAAHERRRLRRRVNDTLDSLAAAGRPGGGHCYGYRRGVDDDGHATLVVDPAQAAIVEETAQRILAGWSLSAIARDLSARGVPTLHGGRWTHGNVKGMVVSPTAAGLRVKRGTVVRRGTWTPLLDEGTWRTVCALLERPERRTARSYLLTGIAVCGRCGAGLTGRVNNGRSGRRSIYFCSPTTGGCSRLGVNADPLDAFVTAELLDALDSPEFRAALTADDEHEARRAGLVTELEEIEQRHVELADRWAQGDMPSEAWDRARATLDARKKTVQTALAEVPAPVVDFDLDTVRAGWEAMSTAERRTLIGMFIEAVDVAPATPGAKAFDPSRASIRWR